MILGISASGRKDRITAQTVKAVLENTGLEYEYVSLAGKRINGCIGCTQCAKDNRCRVEDDWTEIGEMMRKADAIVFGAPNYYGNINALGHACLERTFCFRHREVYSLAGKLGVVVGVDGRGDTSVQEFIKKIMLSNMMVVVDTVTASGYSQCYTCGYGQDCANGNVVREHGFLYKIENKHCPRRFEEQEEAKFQAYKFGKILGSILRNHNSTKDLSKIQGL